MFDLMRWLDDAPIRLTKGIGSPDAGGCWMAAISVYSGAEWGDHPPCVCPIIAKLCIVANDVISNAVARGEIIGPYLLEPVGTATDDADIIERRRWHLVDAAMRRWAPLSAVAAMMAERAKRILTSQTVTKHNAALATANAADAAALAAYATADRSAFVRDHILPVILELCAIGSRVIHEPACDRDAFRRAVQIV